MEDKEVSYFCNGFFDTCPHRGRETVQFRRGYALTECKSGGNYYSYKPCRQALWSYNDTPEIRHWVVPHPHSPAKNGKVKIIRKGVVK